MSTKITGVAEALRVIGFDAEEIKAVADVAGDLEIVDGKVVAKAAKTSQSLASSELVSDRWNQGQMHRVPTREQINTGPAEAASGSGAEKMVRDYSNPAPQQGIQLEAERLASELGSMRAYARALEQDLATMKGQNDRLTGVLTTVLTKVASEHEEATPDAATVEFATAAAGKARSCFNAAKRYVVKSEKLRDDIDDLEGDARRACKAQIKALRKRASRLLVGAAEAAFAAKAGGSDPAQEIHKAINDLLAGDRVLKADMSAFEDKKKEKDEDKDAEKAIKRLGKKVAAKLAAKAAKKAAKAAPAEVDKAKGDDKGNQADKQDPDTKNQDDTAKAAVEAASARVDEALKGVAVLQTDLRGLMETIAGKPLTTNATQPPALALVKSDGGQAYLGLSARIDEMADNDQLDSIEIMKAKSLVSQLSAVHAGRMDKDVWLSAVEVAPVRVKEIFKAVA